MIKFKRFLEQSVVREGGVISREELEGVRQGTRKLLEGVEMLSILTGGCSHKYSSPSSTLGCVFPWIGIPCQFVGGVLAYRSNREHLQKQIVFQKKV